jgi:hypothetical protein
MPGSLISHSRRVVYVGLVGGCDLASIAVRQAQSVFRFDRRPSYFSHCFLFEGRGSRILECKVVGADPSRPEHNGVSKTDARAYSDGSLYPNRALIGFEFGRHAGRERRRAVLDRAKYPNASVDRIDLWSMVCDWQPYLFDSHRYRNPLLESTPHPGAAFVTWALDAGGIDVTMGASEPTDAPEHIWAVANWWSEAHGGEDFDVKISIATSIRHKDCSYPKPDEF